MTKLELQAWNAKYPDGSPCFMVLEDGKEIETTTRSSAWFQTGLIPVVLVRDLHGPFPISRLRMIEKQKIRCLFQCLSYAPPLHRPDENIENYVHHNFEEYSKPLERVRTLSDLVEAASAKKSVVCPGNWAWSKPKPAAVVINLNGITLHRMIEQGIYVYDKPKP